MPWSKRDLAPLWRGAPHADELEPYATLRGHTAPVLALAYGQQHRTLYSAGMDCRIRVWCLPETRVFSAYGTSSTTQQDGTLIGYLVGHTDSVWSLQLHPYLEYLASASADGSIGLWSTEGSTLGQEAGSAEASFVLPALATLGGDLAMDSTPVAGPEATAAGYDVPSCVAWVPTDVTKLLGGFTSSRVAIFDVKRGAQTLELLPTGDRPRPAVTSACCHHIMQVAVTGHADNCARLADLVSGRFVSVFNGHTDAVTSVCLDPVRGHSLITGSHDGCIRRFDLRTGRCLHRVPLHLRKYDEAVHCVHCAPRLLAAAGADGGVAVILPAE